MYFTVSIDRFERIGLDLIPRRGQIEVGDLGKYLPMYMETFELKMEFEFC